jgi:hypothetical protein
MASSVKVVVLYFHELSIIGKMFIDEHGGPVINQIMKEPRLLLHSGHNRADDYDFVSMRGYPSQIRVESIPLFSAEPSQIAAKAYLSSLEGRK